MNTLQLKALLKISTLLFLQSLLVYSIITLPALLIWPMYLYSLFYAATFGWIAWLLLLISLILLVKTHTSNLFGISCVLLFVYVGILIGYALIATQIFSMDPLHDHDFILFPLAAILAASICLFKYRKSIEGIIIELRQIPLMSE